MNDYSKDLDKALEVLAKGGVILYPTDTIWGIGCDATDGKAVRKIYELKKREEKKSLITLVAGADMVGRYVQDASPKLLSLMLAPGRPTTAIFRNAVGLPSQLVNEDGSIAMRIPKDDFCQQLIRRLGKPLVSTSANISGDPFPRNFGEVDVKIKSGVDYTVQHRQNDFSESLPSSIIRLNGEDEIEVIR